MKLTDNLFDLISNDRSNYIIKLSTKNHPVFKAHFPENSILPGFLQIDIISSLLKHKIISIKKAKFISLIFPEDIIKYNITSKDNKIFKIIIIKEDKKISEVIYETE